MRVLLQCVTILLGAGTFGCASYQSPAYPPQPPPDLTHLVVGEYSIEAADILAASERGFAGSIPELLPSTEHNQPIMAIPQGTLALNQDHSFSINLRIIDRANENTIIHFDVITGTFLVPYADYIIFETDDGDSRDYRFRIFREQGMPKTMDLGVLGFPLRMKDASAKHLESSLQSMYLAFKN